MLSSGIDISDKLNLWSTTAAVIRLKKNYFEWLQISDSLILVIYKDNSFKLLVDDYDHDREVMLIWKKLAAKKIGNIHGIIWKEIPPTRKNANETFGLMNGEKKFTNFLRTGKENLQNVSVKWKRPTQSVGNIQDTSSTMI